MKDLLLSLKLNLRKLILISTILSVSGLFVVSVFILNYVIKQQLIQNSLSVNEKYAEKIALSADQHFSDMLKELEYSAAQLEKDLNNPVLKYNEVSRLKNQSDNFNSILLVSAKQQMLAYSPSSLGLSFQQTYGTEGIIESLQKKKTYISSPYWSVNNNLVIMMSKPIHGKNNQYLGLISGIIHLHKKNVLNEMLSNQGRVKLEVRHKPPN